MKKALVLLSGLLLAACGDKAITTEDLVSTMKASGVEINDVKDLKNDEFAVKGFKDRFGFSIPEVAPKGGQAFICDQKEQCTPVYTYFDALKGLAGPYLYQSPNGKVVLQLNSKLSVETAKKLEQAISKY
ncbi:hypothetical protein [Pasteurella multocida]|uniref:hypothetical protein n=1 Tax=Pasteurella multocida TaxID=747 RepID=UPI000BBD3CAF|nr:hypothetical protein [Pasteurella multocida]ATF75304.1 hypothetical protein CO688_07830 [Pasteurella multocida]ATN17705.1 hypothetical protein CRN72_08120 [Pasteurella multocida]MDX3892437.1 hypothetical protein [Pasteurella multocida]BDE03420.1 hypothetical protein PASm1_13220 [Pasteurella multocida]BDE03596.1 hypothetical protein PASm1_14980 [Pasteurella multocida]